MRSSTRFSFLVLVALCPVPAFASDATVEVTNGSLRITAVAGGPTLYVNSMGLSDPHSMNITPEIGDTVNGSAATQLFEGVKKDVVVDMLGGAVYLADLSIPRDLKVTISSAVQSLISLARSDVGRDVRYRGGDAADKLQFSESVVVGRDVRFDAREGDDITAITLASIGGRVTVEESPGTDSVLVSDSRVDESVRFIDRDGTTTFTLIRDTVDSILAAGGAGGEQFYIAEVLVLDDTRVSLGAGGNGLSVSGSTFLGSARFSGGAEDDDIAVQSNTTFARGVSIALGEGTNGLDFVSSTVSGDLNVRGGSGADQVACGGDTVEGSFRMRLGSAPGGQKNEVDISGCLIGKTLLCVGGSGVDDIDAGSNYIGGEFRVAFGAGANEIVASGDCRELRVSTGADADAIVIGVSTRTSQDVRVDAGNGANLINFGAVVVQRDVIVNAGSGDDMLLIATAAVIGGKTKVDLGGGTNTGP